MKTILTKNDAEKSVIIFSDMHIGTDKPYGWFNSSEQSHFKSTVNNILELDKPYWLIFAGDIFDTWVFDIHDKPSTFTEIIQRRDNVDGVIPCLRKLVQHAEKAFYLEGNHDMFISQEQINLISKEITLISNQHLVEEISNEFGAGKMHVEHGHLGDIFNMDVRDYPQYTHCNLPLGYFIARLYVNFSIPKDMTRDGYFLDLINSALINIASSAIKASNSNREETTDSSNKSVDEIALTFPSIPKINKIVHKLVHEGAKKVHHVEDIALNELEEIVGDKFTDLMYKHGHILVDALIDGLCIPGEHGHGIRLKETIKMQNQNDDITVSDVKKRYKDYFKLLKITYKNDGRAALNSILGTYKGDNFEWYADRLQKQVNVETVILGHTHKSQEGGHTSKGGNYTNNGCWCAIPPMKKSKEVLSYTDIKNKNFKKPEVITL